MAPKAFWLLPIPLPFLYMAIWYLYIVRIQVISKAALLISILPTYSDQDRGFLLFLLLLSVLYYFFLCRFHKPQAACFLRSGFGGRRGTQAARQGRCEPPGHINLEREGRQSKSHVFMPRAETQKKKKKEYVEEENEQRVAGMRWSWRSHIFHLGPVGGGRETGGS